MHTAAWQGILSDTGMGLHTMIDQGKTQQRRLAVQHTGMNTEAILCMSTQLTHHLGIIRAVIITLLLQGEQGLDLVDRQLIKCSQAQYCSVSHASSVHQRRTQCRIQYGQVAPLWTHCCLF